MSQGSTEGTSSQDMTRQFDLAGDSLPTPNAGSTVDSAAEQAAAAADTLCVLCPSCHSRTPLAENASLADVHCSCCGSKLELVSEGVPLPDDGSAGAHRPQTIGHFELLERLGAGGFGVVWKAHDLQLDRIVALKIPHRGRLDLAETEKFLREARAAAQLRHPNIVSVHEVGVEAGCVYIVSSFIEGLSLDNWLKDQRLTGRDAAALCVRIAEALQHAHERGIVHRDLKPSNIMMDLSGQPHLMDFGLAKRAAGDITMTVEGQLLGTPAYMSPEQAKGQGHSADPRTDVYSLGVILFELLTGERPFRGSVQMLIKQVLEDDPPSPRKLNGHLPRDLETICLKCLQKEPARRYQSARAVAEELKRFLSGMPIQARPVGVLSRFGRWCRRNPWIAVAAGIAIACLTFGLVAATVGYVRTSRALAQAQRSQAAADENLRQARQAVDDLYTRVSEDTLLNQPGMQRLRGDLLRRARDYYERFLVQSAGDPQVRDALGLAHFRVGLITEEIESPSKAVSAYESARAIQSELADVDSENVERLKALGDTLNAMGRSFHKQQRPQQALEAYRAARDVRQQLAARQGDRAEFPRMLANTLMNIALVEKERDPAAARETMQKAQAIRQPLLAGGAAEPKLRRDYAMGCYNLATLAIAMKDNAAAEGFLEQARTLFEDLWQHERSDFAALYQLAVCCRIQADVKCARKDREQAITLYATARELMRGLAEKNPSVVEYQVALAEIHINIAQAEWENGKTAEAAGPFEQARALLAPLVTGGAGVEDARYRRNFIVAAYAVAKLHPEPERRAEARKGLEALHQQLERLAGEVPDAAGVAEQRRLTKTAIDNLRAAEAKQSGSSPDR